METVDLIEFVECPYRRVLRDRNNPFEFYSEEEFKSRYHIRKETTQALLQLLSTDLNHVSSKNNCIPPILQLAVALRFFATGQFQTTDSDLVGVSQPSVCRIIHRVSTAIARRRRRFIQFPATTNLQIFKEKFSLVGGMPGVIGCIDCTHIPIVSPGGEDAELYRNHKGFFSINVQATCDPDLFFTSIVCRWPGSTHDSRIFDNSRLCAMFENNMVNGILLGDGGYACREYIMTPVPNPVTAKQKRYNEAHIETRIKVERMFGLWKQRFRCLMIPLRTHLNKTLTIIVATACLHNFALSNGDFFDVEEPTERTATSSTDSGSNNASRAGNIARQQIIVNFF